VVPEGELAFVPARVLAFGWRAQEEVVTVAVKTTVSFAFDELSGTVKGLWTEVPPFEPEIDLIPGKRACDVIVRGHAEIPPMPSGYSSGARTAEIAVGSTSIARFLVDARRTGRIPLTPSSVGRAGSGAELDLVPKRPPDFSRVLDGSFELESCQLVGPSQRVPLDEPVSAVTLSGLLEPNDPLTVTLPILTPRLLVDHAASYEEMSEAPLVLDTLLVDLDRRALDLVWRTVIEGKLESIDRLILGFVPDLPEDPEVRWSRVLRELPRGRFQLAYSADDVRERREPPELDEPSLEMARLETWDHPIGPTPQISLEKYARVTADLMEQRMTRELTLAKYGLDERSFAIEERAWSSMFATIPDEEPSLTTRFGELIIKFQDELAGPGEADLGLAEYAGLAARMETREPMKVLADAKLSQPAFMRLERRVDAMIEADPKLASELEEEMARVRTELPAQSFDDLPPEVKKELEP
jgi:hypothetical protein